jgi:phosphatidylinositol glycan class B
MLRRWLPDPNERARFVRWMLIALALHSVAALFSSGWYAYDEHWQILEFANAFLGRGARADLPWEYAARVRPTLQPLLYAGLEKLLLLGGVTSPFTLAMVFRVVTGVAAWAAMATAGAACLRWFRGSPARNWVAPTLALSWFLPYLHVRTSSENASELMFLAGFAVLVIAAGGSEGRHDEDASRFPGAFVLVGLFLGLSFEFRFQTGFMVAGALLWSVFVGRVGWRATVALAAGVAGALLIGTVADRVFYGSWVCAPLSYFRVNILEHRASSFGTSPWWMYFRVMIDRIGPPLSVLVAIGVLWGWIRRPLSLVTWSMIPFVLAHVAIAHKEFRFFFPLATLAVLLTLRSVDDARIALPQLWTALRGNRWARLLFWLLLVEDGVLLAASALRPSQQTMPLYEHIWAMQPPAGTIYYHQLGGGRREQPYDFGQNLILRFYMPPDLHMVGVTTPAELDRHLQTGPAWLIGYGFNLAPEAGVLRDECVPEARSMPEWLSHFNINHWIDRTPIWTLYRCRSRIRTARETGSALRPVCVLAKACQLADITPVCSGRNRQTVVSRDSCSSSSRLVGTT